MSYYAMTYRAEGALRVMRIVAATGAAAWDRAFDIAEAMGEVRSFAVTKV